MGRGLARGAACQSPGRDGGGAGAAAFQNPSDAAVFSQCIRGRGGAHVPAGFHALRAPIPRAEDQGGGCGAKGGVMRGLCPGLRGQMQAAHGGQSRRVRHFDHYHWGGTRAQRLFGRPLQVFVTPRMGKDQTSGVEVIDKAAGMQAVGLP